LRKVKCVKLMRNGR